MEWVNMIIDALGVLTPIVVVLSGTGLVVKYMPILRKFLPNEGIRLLNALIAFFGAFGPSPAQAGVIGDIIGRVGFFGKLGASYALALAAEWFYEKELRKRLVQLGIKKPADSI